MGDYYCAGSLDTHVVFGIFVASLRAVGCATTLASAGLWLARQGMMTPALSKGLSQLSVKLAIPCLLFSSVVPGVSPHVLSYGWPLLLLPAVHLLLGMLVGCLLILCFVLGIVREAAGAGANAGLIVTLLEALLGLILVPAWFVWLAVGLGRGKSVEEMSADEGVGVEKPEEPEEAVGEIKPPARPAQLKKPKKKAAAAGTTSNPMAEMDLMGSSEED